MFMSVLPMFSSGEYSRLTMPRLSSDSRIEPENIERVRRDEERARLEAEGFEQRSLEMESEARLDSLRRKALKRRR